MACSFSISSWKLVIVILERATPYLEINSNNFSLPYLETYSSIKFTEFGIMCPCSSTRPGTLNFIFALKVLDKFLLTK